MSKDSDISCAIRVAGSQPKLAARAGISQQHVSKLLNRERRVTAEVAVAIEAATNGAVPRHKLRPDLWSAG